MVDSGAQGFVYWVRGAHDALKGGADPFRELEEMKKNMTAVRDFEGANVQFTDTRQEDYDADHRYCTEFVCRLKPTKASHRAAKLAKSFEAYGNSLVPLKVPGKEPGSQLFKLHIHTQDPESVFKHARDELAPPKASGELDPLLKMKVEDMATQVAAAGFDFGDSGDVGIGIYSANAMPSIMQEKGGFPMAHAVVCTSDEEFISRHDILPSELRDLIRLKDPILKTAAPAVGAFIQLFERMLEKKKEVMYISCGINISAGAVNACNKAWSTLSVEKQKRVTIYDGRGLAGISTMLALKARQLADQGKKASEIVPELDKLRSSIMYFGVVPTLKYAKRGGRIPAVICDIGDTLGANVVMKWDCDQGKFKPFTATMFCNGFPRAIDAVMSALERGIPVGASGSERARYREI